LIGNTIYVIILVSFELNTLENYIDRRISL